MPETPAPIAARAPKNIVICCDGTGNSFTDVQTESNVVKFYRCLEIDGRQVAYYHPGVGTLGDPTHRTRLARWWSLVKGLAFGAGLIANVSDAYRYLMNTYNDGDRIVLIGFSRGAYTIRVLASVIHMFGLLCAGNEGLIPYIMKRYTDWSRSASYSENTGPDDPAFKWSFSHHNVTIHFCGLWDTVSSYGWIYKPIKLAFEGRNPSIKVGRHALSIHERRCFYAAKPWGKPEPGSDQDIRQVWFAGVHSDVGGSYCECSSGLSKITLEWLLLQARDAGILFNEDKVAVILGLKPKPLPQLPDYLPPNPNGMIHISLKRLWWVAEFLLQRNPYLKRTTYYIPRGRGRTIPSGALIHETAFHRPWPGQLPTSAYAVEPWRRYLPDTSGPAEPAHSGTVTKLYPRSQLVSVPPPALAATRQ